MSTRNFANSYTKISETSTSNCGELQSFKKTYPNLDRICNASLIRELFKVSKVDSLSLIENHPKINLLFKNLEEKVEQLDHLVIEELRKFFTNSEIQAQLEELRKVHKEHKEYTKVIQEKLRALDLCKEMFVEMERSHGHEMDKADLSLEDIEQMLIESSGNFQEKYRAFIEKKAVNDAAEKLKALAKDHKLVLVADDKINSTEISPNQIVIDKYTGDLVILPST